MDRAIVVSADGHASMPEASSGPSTSSRSTTSTCPQLIAENELSNKVLWMLNNLMISEDAAPVFDGDGLYGAGRWSGL